jgi:hypothetical protein
MDYLRCRNRRLLLLPRASQDDPPRSGLQNQHLFRSGFRPSNSRARPASTECSRSHWSISLFQRPIERPDHLHIIADEVIEVSDKLQHSLRSGRRASFILSEDFSAPSGTPLCARAAKARTVASRRMLVPLRRGFVRIMISRFVAHYQTIHFESWPPSLPGGNTSTKPTEFEALQIISGLRERAKQPDGITLERTPLPRTTPSMAYVHWSKSIRNVFRQ